MKKIAHFVSLALMFVTLLLPSSVEAKRLLPQVASARRPAVKSAPQVYSRGVASKVKFRADKKAINITFSNLVIAKSIAYALTYSNNDKQEAVIGSVQTSEGDGAVRELLFGTCSSGVCTYHTNITKAKLVITTTLKNGKKVVKPYRIKV